MCQKSEGDLRFTIWDSGFRIYVFLGRQRLSREEAFLLGTISQQYLFVKKRIETSKAFLNVESTRRKQRKIYNPLEADASII